MTKPIEQEFYEAFDIPKKDFKGCDYPADCPYDAIPCDNCPHYKVYETDYPPIIDGRIVELICVLNKFKILEYACGSRLYKTDRNTLIKEVISDVVFLYKVIGNNDRKKDFYNEVRKIMGVEDAR